MFNISTRKGLGLGVVAALATTLFAGAPAAQAVQAPITLTANDSYGTYTVLNGTGFDMKSWVTNAALTGGYHNYLRYNIKNVGTTATNIRVEAGVDGWGDGYTAENNSTLSKGDDYSYYAFNNGYDYYENNLNVAANNYNNTADSKLQITAFVDYNDNGVVDPNEPAAAPLTITYVNAKGIAATTAIQSTYEGDSQIKADVTFANKDINLEQVANSISWPWDFHGQYTSEWDASNLGVYWTRNTTDESFTGYDNDYRFDSIDDNYGNVSYDSDAKAIVFPWTNNIDGGSDYVAKGLYTATLYEFQADNSTYEWNKVGNTAQASVAANVVDEVSTPVATTNANIIDYYYKGYEDYYVARADSAKSVVYTSTVTNVDGDPVGAGIKANFYVWDYSLEPSSKITVGTQTLLPNGSQLTIPVTTDANGKISITITAAAVDGDEIGVSADAQGVDSGNSYIWWENTDYQIYGQPGDDRSVAVGGTSTITYRVEDQFNQAAPAGYQVEVTRESESNRDTQANWSYLVPVSNGTATVSIKDNGAGFGYDYVDASLYKINGSGLGDYQSSDYGLYLYYTDATLLTATKVTAAFNNDGGSSYQPVQLSDVSTFVASNENQSNTLDAYDWAGHNTFSSPSQPTANGYLEISGTVTAGLVDGAYVPVTISLPGAVFEVYSNADDGYNDDYSTSKNSVTTYTDANGYYSAYVYSDVPGKQTATVTAGSVKATADVTFAQSTPKSVALSVAGGAATAQTGRSAAVSATVKDKNGHVVSGVTVTFTATGGSGSLSATTADTDANGVATVNYVTGVADTGSVDFTASALTGDDKITSSKVTVSFVRSSGNVTHNKKGVATAHWSNAKGQTVLVVVDGYRRYNQVELSDAANFFSKKLKKGRHTVNLYIGGVLVDSLKFTVKK